jgi:uncharacterized membrane protein YedE/YeeE
MRGAAAAWALSSGMLFAVGLGLGGMTRPANVIAFLDVAGDWNPNLAFVMLGAAGTYAALYPLIVRRRAPLVASTFALPPRRPVDGRLVAGAAIFGLGWGTAGYCPGPAIVALGAGARPALVFVLAMLTGMALGQIAIAAAEYRAYAIRGRTSRPPVGRLRSAGGGRSRRTSVR